VNFQQFAEQHGLMIDSLILDRWVRVPTVDHPKKRNGAYIWDGREGALINFAVHDKHVLYRSDEPWKPDPQAAAKRRQMEQERLKRQASAANKAAWILNQASLMQHPYLIRKGFEDKGYVWRNSLVLPMRVGDRLVGCQLIDADGNKRFLSGQVTKGASLMLNNKGQNILVEGFATGLSVRRVLRHLRQRYCIHVCFSAGNMIEVARGMDNPLVVADHDPTGIRAAKKISSRVWLDGEPGEDFNDAEMRLGTPAAAATLSQLL
jgi:putative DNA primase/helicase